MRWPVVSLDNVALIQGGIQKQPKRAPNLNPAPFLRVANVTSRGLDLAEIHQIELFDGDAERYRLQYGDLLVVEGNGSADQIGRAGMWRNEIPRAVHQNHLLRVRPAGDLDPRYLELWWNSPSSREYLTEVASSSSGLHTLSVRKLKAVRLPLPPLNEQRRIVHILEVHLSRIDASKDGLSRVLQRCERLRVSRAVAAHVGRDAEPWRLADLLRAPLTNGKSVPTREGGFPVLRLSAISDGHVLLNEAKEGAWDRDTARRFLVREGDVLIVRGNGAKRLVGRAGLVGEVESEVAFPDTLIRAATNSDLVFPAYLTWALNSSSVRAQIEACARTSAGIYKINQRDLSGLLICVPSPADQEHILREIAAADDTSRDLVGTIEEAARRVRVLRGALFAAAFTGQLTGRDSDLERAEELAGT